MVLLFGNQKYACRKCIKGHRTSKCQHVDSPDLQLIRRRGRPFKRCKYCRDKKGKWTTSTTLSCSCLRKGQVVALNTSKPYMDCTQLVPIENQASASYDTRSVCTSFGRPTPFLVAHNGLEDGPDEHDARPARPLDPTVPNTLTPATARSLLSRPDELYPALYYSYEPALSTFWDATQAGPLEPTSTNNEVGKRWNQSSPAVNMSPPRLAPCPNSLFSPGNTSSDNTSSGAASGYHASPDHAGPWGEAWASSSESTSSNVALASVLFSPSPAQGGTGLSGLGGPWFYSPHGRGTNFCSLKTQAALPMHFPTGWPMSYPGIATEWDKSVELDGLARSSANGFYQ